MDVQEFKKVFKKLIDSTIVKLWIVWQVFDGIFQLKLFVYAQRDIKDGNDVINTPSHDKGCPQPISQVLLIWRSLRRWPFFDQRVNRICNNLPNVKYVQNAHGKTAWTIAHLLPPSMWCCRCLKDNKESEHEI